MASLTISLPDDTLKYLEEKAREGGHASVDAYLGAVLHEIRLIEAKKKFEAKIQEAIDSGPAVPVTAEMWETLRREVFEEVEAERAARKAPEGAEDAEDAVKRAFVERPQARRDLRQIARYLAIKRKSPRSADRLLLAAERTYQQIASHPVIGELYAHHDPAFAGIRIATVDRFRSYLIVYRTTDDRIEILRVLHGARDVDQILAEDLGPPG